MGILIEKIDEKILETLRGAGLYFHYCPDEKMLCTPEVNPNGIHVDVAVEQGLVEVVNA